MKFMYAAFAATWIIHIAYLGIMTRGYRRVREEIDELRRR
jgi:hypothetical protein